MKLPTDKIKYIVTHGGNCHHDDIYACGIMLHFYPEATIYRRDPSLEELSDPEIVIIDVGKEYDPSLKNFDHHQFTTQREYPEENKCAVDLILEYIEFSKLEKDLCPWLEPVRINDCLGPQFMASYYGMGNVKYTLGMIYNPTHETLSRQMTKEDVIMPSDFIHTYLKMIGEQIISGTSKHVEELDTIENQLRFYTLNGLQIVECKQIVNPTLLNIWFTNPFVKRKRKFKKIDLTITRRADRNKTNKNDTLVVFTNKIATNNVIDFKKVEAATSKIPWLSEKFVFRHKSNYMLVTKELTNTELQELLHLIK